MRGNAFLILALALCSTTAIAAPAGNLRIRQTPGYVPPAVHIDYNSAYGVGSALTSTGTTVPGGDTGAVADSGDYTLSFWVQGLIGDAATGSNAQSQLFGNQWLANDPPGSVNSAENQPGAEVNTDQANGYGTLRVNNGTSAAAVGDGGVNECNGASVTAPVASNAPQHILISAHTTGTGSANKLLAAYVNDVLVVQGCIYGGGTGAMLINFANARGWFLANGTGAVAQGHYGDFTVSDVYFDMSHSIVTASNTILAADRAKFATTDGTNRPVDLGPHCVLFNGFTPQICLTGNKTNFLVNKGTVVGLTNSGAQLITDADYGPAGLLTHTVGVTGGFVESFAPAGLTSYTTHSDGVAINSGDLVLLALWLVDNSNAPGDHAPQCPSGFTGMVGTGFTNGASYDGSSTSPTDLAVCWKIAGAGETGHYQWNWTAVATRNANSGMLIFSGFNAAAPFDGVKVIKQSTLVNPPAACASVTTTNANDRLYTAFFSFDLSSAKPGLTPPSGSNWVVHGKPGGVMPANGWADDQLVAAGATATKQWTAGATLRGQCLTIAIAPN